jgi:hypothetical protein
MHGASVKRHDQGRQPEETQGFGQRVRYSSNGASINEVTRPEGLRMGTRLQQSRPMFIEIAQRVVNGVDHGTGRHRGACYLIETGGSLLE